MKTITEIMDYVGDDVIMAALGVGPDSIRKARRSESLPASWYAAMERMTGRPLPRELFNFKGAA